MDIDAVPSRLMALAANARNRTVVWQQARSVKEFIILDSRNGGVYRRWRLACGVQIFKLQACAAHDLRELAGTRCPNQCHVLAPKRMNTGSNLCTITPRI